jgi:uncharacterized protein YkwD
MFIRSLKPRHQSTRAMGLAYASWVAFGALSCGPRTPAKEIGAHEAKPSSATEVSGGGKPTTPREIDAVDAAFDWAPSTFSGPPASPGDAELEGVVRACGEGDAALHDVARTLAELGAERVASDRDLLTYLLRKRGAPYANVELLLAEVGSSDLGEVERASSKWAAKGSRQRSVRCGAGLAPTPAGHLVVVLRAPKWGELLPIPTEVPARTPFQVEVRWTDLAYSAELVAMPPEGRARRTPLLPSGDGAQTEITLPSPGVWTLQILVKTEGGPTPAFLAVVHVGTALSTYSEEPSVPGEAASSKGKDREATMLEMMNEARRASGVRLLRRNARLDQLATDHARAMAKRGEISHDLGDGPPGRRLEAASFKFQGVGENVALAESVKRLHRAIWASPSHRENLLLSSWEVVGIGIAEDDEGRLFLAQIFVDL